jgi:type IV secretory pathway VirJ component
LPEAGQGAACSAEGARAFTLAVPHAEWLAASDPAAGVEQAWRKLAGHPAALAPPPAQLADLPIVEVPAAPGGRAGGPFAVLLSGDGGWAGIDKSLGAAFAAQGIPVAGFDSLRYFWSARTPDGLAADLDRVIRYYAARWGRSQVLLVGYSQGADVLPFALNRLPPATRASVRLTALLGPGQKASFEFHVANWLGPSGDLPIAPEARRLAAEDTLCLYGVDEKDSLCPELAPAHARVMPLTGGHHFGGDYDALAARILAAMPH